MKKGWVIVLSIVGLFVLIAMAFGGTYNALVRMDEGVTKAWAQVENVYQRRLDLIPNLVETVKGYAAHEKSTLLAVTDARAKAAGSLSGDAFNDPGKFSQFAESQAALGTALSRLMVVVEKYPDLKASDNFLSLQVQLEGTENRISVERGRFNEAAQALNTKLRQFPTNILGNLFGFKTKEYFKANTGAEKAPQVSF